jgi:hypothetical protein
MARKSKKNGFDWQNAGVWAIAGILFNYVIAVYGQGILYWLSPTSGIAFAGWFLNLMGNPFGLPSGLGWILNWSSLVFAALGGYKVFPKVIE